LIQSSVLQQCYDSLYVYDVEQQGWEQEPNGAQANLAHTLTHLVKDAYRKDFNDPQLVREAIAPDSLMYALRFVRWGELLLPEVLQGVLSVMAQDDRSARVIHAEASDAIADLIHEEDHASSREGALTERKAKLGKATTLLIASAQRQSDEYDFDLGQAFLHRLKQLRLRFNIPEPK
jgi:hypothetical protein